MPLVPIFLTIFSLEKKKRPISHWALTGTYATVLVRQVVWIPRDQKWMDLQENVESENSEVYKHVPRKKLAIKTAIANEKGLQ